MTINTINSIAINGSIKRNFIEFLHDIVFIVIQKLTSLMILPGKTPKGVSRVHYK